MRAWWTNHDEAFLREHYPWRGPVWVAARLGRSECSVRWKAKTLGVRCKGFGFAGNGWRLAA